MQGEFSAAIQKVPGFGDTLVGLLPRNIFAAFSNGRVDQIIIFALFLGISILFLPKAQKDYLSNFFENLSAAFRKLIWIVMEYAPIGVFALMATTVGKYGPMLIGFVTKYIVATYISVIAMFVIYTVLLILFGKMSPVRFYKAAYKVIIYNT